MKLSRRDLIIASLPPVGTVLTGCVGSGARRNGPTVATRREPVRDPFHGGEKLGVVEFVGEGRPPLDTAFGEGLDGRLYTDLTRLSPEGTSVPNDSFYIRTRCPERLDAGSDWNLRLHGMVARPVDLPISDLLKAERPMGVHLMECAGNTAGGRFGMIGAAEWSGVPLAEVLDRVQPHPGTNRISVAGYDRHLRGSRHSVAGASWIFTREQLEEAGAFLATRMNGEPLPRDHGYPVRLLVPGWYGCVSAKWVNEIRWVNDDEPATTQMREFAVRTHQSGIPQLARNYLPARIDRAAMPIRVEKWRVDGKLRYRVVGIAWGGRGERDLEIRFTPDGAYEPVADPPPAGETASWSLWSHPFQPTVAADYAIQLRLADRTVTTRRLDRGHYLRYARIDEV